MRGGSGAGSLIVSAELAEAGVSKKQFRDAAASAISTADDIAKNFASLKRPPMMTSVVVDAATGVRYPAVSLGNKLSRQPTEIAEALRKAIPKESLEAWQVSNCAEFNAVNNALLQGSRPQDIVVRTIRTSTQEAVTPCLNCKTWLDKMGIKNAE